MMTEQLIPNGFCVLPRVSEFRDNDGVTAPCCLYRAYEPGSTRKWVQAWNELHPNSHNLSNDLLKGYLRHPWSRDPSEWDDLWERSKSLRTLNFAGGEPFLSPEIENFLQRFIDSGKSENVSLHFITNLTVLPESLLSKFSSFRQTSLTVSLDGAGDLNDYIRSFSDFEVIAKHMQQLDQRFQELKLDRVSVNTTFQAYNALGIEDLVDFLKQFKNILPLPYLNPLREPNYFSAKVLPLEIRNLAARHLEKLAIEATHAPDWLRTSFNQASQFLRESDSKYEKLLDVLKRETIKLERTSSGHNLKQLAPELYMSLYLN